MLNNFFRRFKWFLAFIILSSIILSFLYLRMKSAEKNLEEYFLAKNCPSAENCRKKIEATILDSHGLTIYVKGFKLKTGGLPSSQTTAYTFLISSSLGEQESIISANSPYNGIPFDIENISFPTGRDSYFIQENFSANETAFIEVWRGEITILYTDTLIDIPNSVIPPTPSPLIQGNQTFTKHLQPKTYKIALPTIIHPIFLEADAQKDFYGLLLIAGTIIIFGGILIFGESIGVIKKPKRTHDHTN